MVPLQRKLYMYNTTSKTSSSKQNAKKYRGNAYFNWSMWAVRLYLRGFYIIAVTRVFCVNKFKKMCRTAQYHRVFGKHEKTHDRF